MKSNDPRAKYHPIEVECYSECKANERPVAFNHQGERREISEILDRWYEGGIEPDRPLVDYFKVKAESDIYILRNESETDTWAVIFSDLK